MGSHELPKVDWTPFLGEDGYLNLHFEEWGRFSVKLSERDIERLQSAIIPPDPFDVLFDKRYEAEVKRLKALHPEGFRIDVDDIIRECCIEVGHKFKPVIRNYTHDVCLRCNEFKETVL